MKPLVLLDSTSCPWLVRLILFFAATSLFGQAPASLEGKIIRLGPMAQSGSRNVYFGSVQLSGGRFSSITSFSGSTTATA
jgi:hypothetical protein